MRLGHADTYTLVCRTFDRSNRKYLWSVSYYLDRKYQSSYLRTSLSLPLSLSGAPDAGTKWHPEARTLMSCDHYANYSNLDQDLAVTVQRN